GDSHNVADGCRHSVVGRICNLGSYNKRNFVGSLRERASATVRHLPKTSDTSGGSIEARNNSLGACLRTNLGKDEIGAASNAPVDPYLLRRIPIRSFNQKCGRIACEISSLECDVLANRCFAWSHIYSPIGRLTGYAKSNGGPTCI